MYVPGLIWIGLLNAVAVLAAWVIAFLPAFFAGDSNMAGVLMALLIIAAIAFTVWFIVTFSQATFFLLTDESRGIRALKDSFKLVDGRWWKTLWRLLVPNIVFQIVVAVAVSIVYMVFFMLGFALLGGWMTSLGVSQDVGMDAMRASSVGFGLVGVVLGIIFFVAMILVFAIEIVAQSIFQGSVSARLFHSLKATKAK
jgi:hypothetical protein